MSGTTDYQYRSQYTLATSDLSLGTGADSFLTGNTSNDTKQDPALGAQVPENAFHDLTPRTSIFRNKLIEEFQLLENLQDASTVPPPTHSSMEIVDPTARTKLLRENPYQLIKFKAFKRTQQLDSGPKTDRRLTRAKNVDSLPIGAWANWVVQQPAFENFMLIVIVFNAVLVGISAELQDRQADHIQLFQFISIFDAFTTVIFVLEIAIKWIDDFYGFWKDGWNITDFVVTALTAIPELIQAAQAGSSTDQLGSIGKQLRTLRILRTVKLIVRFGTLKVIVLTILQAFESMAFIMLLLLLVAYTFAIVAMNLFESYTKSGDTSLVYGDYWSSLGNSLMSLFQLLTLDQWDVINQELTKYSDATGTAIFIILWVMLGAFIFRNIFVGVMVQNFDRISESLKERKAEYMKAKKFDKMRKKLNKELQVQGNIQKSLTNIRQTLMNEINQKSSPENEASANNNNNENSPSAMNATEGPSSQPQPLQPKQQQQQQQQAPAYDFAKTREADLLETIQKVLVASYGISKGWETTVQETLGALAGKQLETMWPRDTLFRYFQIMENLQENMKEYQELQLMASMALMDLHDN